jgi:hypothetical protein
MLRTPEMLLLKMNNLTVAILHSSDDDPILRLYFSSKFLNETEFFCA